MSQTILYGAWMPHKTIDLSLEICRIAGFGRTRLDAAVWGKVNIEIELKLTLNWLVMRSAIRMINTGFYERPGAWFFSHSNK